MIQPVLADHFVESNLAFSFKFYVNNSKVETDTTESRTYSTYTLKNFDLIDAYNAVKTTEGIFTKKARIIKEDERFSGLVQGTYKASGAKIIPVPAT